jgi:heterodisulfide reductase subunit A
MEGDGVAKTATHDMVVLAVGLLPRPVPSGMFAQGELERDAVSYVKEPDEELEPGRTSLPGVFAIGGTTAARDIPDTVLHAGAAAAQIASYLKGRATT